MKRSERLNKNLNRLMIVWAVAALLSVVGATKMEGHHEQQSLSRIVAGN